VSLYTETGKQLKFTRYDLDQGLSWKTADLMEEEGRSLIGPTPRMSHYNYQIGSVPVGGHTAETPSLYSVDHLVHSRLFISAPCHDVFVVGCDVTRKHRAILLGLEDGSSIRRPPGI